MSNIVINGTTYNGVESITVKDTSGSDVKYTKGERPSGTIEITENGVHDVTNYESANVNVSTSAGVDRFQWKCDNVKSLYYEFYDYTGTDLSILEGLDTSQVEDIRYSFQNCKNIEYLPEFNVSSLKFSNNAFSSCSKLKNFPLKNISDGVNFSSSFSDCSSMTHSEPINLGKPIKIYGVFSGCSSLNTEVIIDMSNVTDGINQTFSRCSKLPKVTLTNINTISSLNNGFNACASLEEIILENTGATKYFTSAFNGCSKAKTIKTIDLYSATNVTTTFSNCRALENLIVKNVRISISLGSMNTWGTLLTASTSQTLTLSYPSSERFSAIYVKLVDITDEMRAEDEYIDNKKPCIECASTDEGAMTLEEYIISKNWTLGV